MSELDPRLESLVDRLRALPGDTARPIARLHHTIREQSPGRDGIVLSRTRAALAFAVVVLLTSSVWFTVMRVQQRGAELRPVQFVLVDATARSVSLAGDFNDWDRQTTPLSRSGNGVWSVVVKLPPGPVSYSFIVDGQTWVSDPNAPLSTDEFGRPSSTVYVSAGDAP